jgi:hypothetical protein
MSGPNPGPPPPGRRLAGPASAAPVRHPQGWRECTYLPRPCYGPASIRRRPVLPRLGRMLRVYPIDCPAPQRGGCQTIPWLRHPQEGGLPAPAPSPATAPSLTGPASALRRDSDKASALTHPHYDSTARLLPHQS